MTEETHEEELFDTEPFAEAAPEPEQAKSEPVRDESGKFAQTVEEAPAQPTPEEAVKPEAKPEQPMVPLAALHEVRDELKAFKAEAERMRQQRQPEQAPQVPDMFEDPEGWQAYQQQQFQTQLYAQRLEVSHRFAVQQHGEESVSTAVDWARAKCDADPYFNQMVASNPDPVGFAVQQFQRDQVASQVDLSEYEQFKAWKAAQAQIAPQQQSTPPPTPPRSIASAPSAGGVQHIAMGSTAVFDEEFN